MRIQRWRCLAFALATGIAGRLGCGSPTFDLAGFERAKSAVMQLDLPGFD